MTKTPTTFVIQYNIQKFMINKVMITKEKDRTGAPP